MDTEGYDERCVCNYLWCILEVQKKKINVKEDGGCYQ
jgi:hypothetical protein